jgi:hypothetical protein
MSLSSKLLERLERWQYSVWNAKDTISSGHFNDRESAVRAMAKLKLEYPKEKFSIIKTDHPNYVPD